MIIFEYQLIIAMLVFLLGAIIAVKNLKWAFYLVILMIPLMHKELFSLVKWDVLPIRVILLGIGFAVSGLLIRWYFNVDSTERIKQIKKYTKNDPFLLILILLLIIRFISIFLTNFTLANFNLFAFYTLVVFTYMLFKYLIVRYGAEFYDKALKIYLSLGLLTGIFVIAQIIGRLNRIKIGGVWVNPGFLPRFGATFWDVNHYGGFLITLIPIYFAYIFIAKKPINKVLLVISTGILGVLLFLTQSRSSWIGLFVGLGISLLIYYWSRLKKPLFIAFLGAILGSMVVLGFTFYQGISIREKAASYMHHRLDSTDTHMMLLDGAAEVFFNNFVVGAGYGGFDVAFRETETATDYFDREPKLREQKVLPHSVWGEVLGETGASGIVLYALLAITIISSLITTVFKVEDKSKKYLGVGIVGSIVSVFTAGLFYSYNMEFYWMMVFLSIGYIFLSFKPNYDIKEVINWWYFRKITPFLVILPLAFFYIYLKLGGTTLIDWDEAIYAKVAKNIVQTGEWLSLRWDDMNEYWFEKPPLYMWLTALAFKITNFNSLGARIVSASFGVAGILAIYYIAKNMYNRLTGVFASLILLSTVHYLYYSRNGMLDVTVTFFILSTLLFFYLASKIWNDEKKHKLAILYLTISGIFLGLGVMTKAVIGLIPLPIIFIYIIYLGFFAKQKIPYLKLLLIPIFGFVVAAPWHIYSIYTHGEEFIDDYFMDHIISRGLSGFGHEKPIWWFLVVIKVSFRIWIVPFVLGVLSLFFIDKEKRNEFIFMLISISFVLLFFSISKDKLQWYIMPIYPFMAIVAARFMEQFLVYVNIVVKKDYQIDPKVLRVLGLFGVFLISSFYVVIMRENVYYSDANKDKVALVKIHNNMYPIEDHPDRRLYYSNIAHPVLLFYSDHRIRSVSDKQILTRIDEAEPDVSYTFLIPEGMYYDVSKRQDEIQAPLVLDIKGAAGEWILFKSVSRVDLLRQEFAAINLELKPLESKYFDGTLTPIELEKYNQLEARLDQVVKQLIEYGHSPYIAPPEK